MSQAQTRQAIASLSQSLFSMFQQLGFTEAKLDSIQSSLDDLVLVANEKTKDSQPEIVVSVDKDRKDRRKKEKEGKDKGKDKDVHVVAEPTTEPAVAKSTARTRNKRSTTVK